MYENDHSLTTPAAARQMGATRRGILALTPLSALAAATSSATLGQVQHEQELIAACGEIIALQSHLNKVCQSGCEIAEEECLNRELAPIAERIDALVDRFSELTAVTLGGHIARAKALTARFPDDIHQPKDSFGQMVSALVYDLVAGERA